MRSKSTKKPVTLVTGAGGEMGHLLLPALKERGHRIVALDLAPLPADLSALCIESVEASILDTDRLNRLIVRYRPECIFHLAAVLSSRAERDPARAHNVNVQGTVGLMHLCLENGRRIGRAYRFLFPSSIAVYGIPDPETKKDAGAVKETEWTRPRGVYGCNKLYCERLGIYYGRMDSSAGDPGLDFRSIRFPGLISAETIPHGGTTDYGPEMLHAAAQGKPYTCFVSPETRLPFMTMVDGVEGFLKLAEAPRSSLSQHVYNIRSFSPSAEEIRGLALEVFPGARIDFAPNAKRQAIVDTWPSDVDDSLARRDWGFAPRYGLREAFLDYLLPALRERYGAAAAREDEPSLR